MVPADKIRVKTARPAGDEDVKVAKKVKSSDADVRVDAAAAKRNKASEGVKPAKDNWKSKNFLTEEDDLEFSFIDMDE